MPALNNLQREDFCQQYVVDKNATQAAIRAKYSTRTAYSQGQRLLKNVEVSARIAELTAQLNAKTQIDAEYVRLQHVAIHEMDAADILGPDGNVLPISHWPKIWRQMISGLDVSEITAGEISLGTLKKIKWPDKLRNLELLGKHVDVGAYRDQHGVDHSGEIGSVTRTIVDPKA
jgi:phage terminase small subunit